MAPASKTTSSLACLSDSLDVESLFICHHVADHSEDILTDVVSVVLSQLVEELDVSHSLLRFWPVWFLLTEVQKHTLKSNNHMLSRVLGLLQVCNVILA